MVTTSATLRIAQICDSHGWKAAEVLRVHARKRTATARIELPTGESAVLKTLLRGASEESARGLREERDFYASGVFELAPKLILGADEYYCRAYEAGEPVRVWLGRGTPPPERLSSTLRTVVTALAASREVRSPSDVGALVVARTIGRLQNLLTSGPAGTKRSSATETTARLGALSLRPFLKRTLPELVRGWHSKGARYVSRFGHNDLHGDNVLITEYGPRIVDFENLTFPGFWWLDAIYFTATCFAAADADTRRQCLRVVNDTFQMLEPSMAPALRALTELFCAAALTNSRFRKGRLSSLDATEILRVPRLISRLGSIER